MIQGGLRQEVRTPESISNSERHYNSDPGKDGRDIHRAREEVRRTKYDLTKPGPVKDTVSRPDPARDIRKKEARDDDRRPHCKDRPERDTRGGGGGKRKEFVPWCGKSRR